MSADSTAVCFTLKKQHPSKKSGSAISEHTRLLEGQRSAVLEIETPKLDRKSTHHVRIEEQAPALKLNPKVQFI